MNMISVIVWSWFSCSKWTEGKFHWDENRSGLERINVRNQLGLCEATAQRVCSWARLHFPPCPRRVFPAGNTLSTLCAPELCWQAVQVSLCGHTCPRQGIQFLGCEERRDPRPRAALPTPTAAHLREESLEQRTGSALEESLLGWREQGRVSTLNTWEMEGVTRKIPLCAAGLWTKQKVIFPGMSSSSLGQNTHWCKAIRLQKSYPGLNSPSVCLRQGRDSSFEESKLEIYSLLSISSYTVVPFSLP